MIIDKSIELVQYLHINFQFERVTVIILIAHKKERTQKVFQTSDYLFCVYYKCFFSPMNFEQERTSSTCFDECIKERL